MSALRVAFVLIGILAAGVAVAAVVVFFPQQFGYVFGEHAGWFALAAFTALTFWRVALFFRRSWRQVRFWLALLGLMTLHTAAYVLILRSVTPWPLIWFALVSIVEIPSLGALLHALGFEFTPSSVGS
jgi:hypothetical protein